MKKEIKSPINLNDFFKIIHPNEIPGLVNFYEEKYTTVFCDNLKENSSRAKGLSYDIGALIFIVLMGVLTFLYGMRFWIPPSLIILSIIIWHTTNFLIGRFYHKEIVRLAKDIKTYVPEQFFISAHSEFLLDYVFKLEKKQTGLDQLTEILQFGISLADISRCLLKKDESSPYCEVVEVYWRTLSKQLNEFGTGESFYEDFSIMAQESLVEKGKISFPGILKETQGLVNAWRKHQNILLIFSPVYDFLILFDSLDKVVQYCLEKKKKSLTIELQELNTQLG